MERHFHTLEIIAVSALTVAIAFHVGRAIGGKLSQSSAPIVAKAGSALAGVFTFSTVGAAAA